MVPDVEVLTRGQGEKPQDAVFSLLFEKDEITWQDIIYDLIKTEKMDPWDVDVSMLAEKFIDLLKEMKKMDFRLSGKIILAAAFFLKIKSDKLLKEDMAALNDLINPEHQEDLLGMLDGMPDEMQIPMEKPVLAFRTPQPRKRKVSVYDLINALEKAFESDNKRTFKKVMGKNYAPIRLPKKDQKDVTVIINDVYKKIEKKMNKMKILTFSELVDSDSKEDKLYTFVPLIYLDSQRKIDLEQPQHFGEINIHLVKEAKK